MENKKVNSHFLQKALVKNFAINNNVKWVKYKTNEKGSFDILNTQNSKQPIARKGFYSIHIEKGMNKLESKGINVIRKIVSHAQYREKIILSREELVTLKHYSLLSSARTKKIRNDIINKDGDSYFNSMVTNSKKIPKEIQENMIQVTLDSWKYYFEETNYHNKFENNNEIDASTKMIISNTLNSRLIIFKFPSSNLLLTEALNFTESNIKYGGILLDFMPISPSIGIAFYFDPVAMRYSGISGQKSLIFENDISVIRNEVKYKNVSLIKKQYLEFMKNSINKEKDHSKFWIIEVAKYYSKEDKFIYEVLNESEDVAGTCNAMALVHCKNSYVIYQDKSDIPDAENKIRDRRIFRLEDYQ